MTEHITVNSSGARAAARFFLLFLFFLRCSSPDLIRLNLKSTSTAMFAFPLIPPDWLPRPLFWFSSLFFSPLPVSYEFVVHLNASSFRMKKSNMMFVRFIWVPLGHLHRRANISGQKQHRIRLLSWKWLVCIFLWCWIGNMVIMF